MILETIQELKQKLKESESTGNEMKEEVMLRKESEKTLDIKINNCTHKISKLRNESTMKKKVEPFL